MKEPFIEKVDLLDTEYAQLLEKGIEPREYLQEKALPASRAKLTKLKLKAATVLIMLCGVGLWAFHLLTYQPNNDATTELKARLILEMHSSRITRARAKTD